MLYIPLEQTRRSVSAMHNKGGTQMNVTDKHTFIKPQKSHSTEQ
jgi:hypothetical protein